MTGAFGYRLGFDRRRGSSSGEAAAPAPALPIGARVAFMGDSITHDTNGLRFFFMERINGRLSLTSGSSQGVSGERLDQGLLRMPQVIASDPAVLTIFMGTNDIPAGRTLGQMQADVAAMIAQAQAHNPAMRIVLLTPLRRGTFNAGQETLRQQYRDWLLTLGSATVHVLNMEGVVTNPADTAQMPDLVHPTMRKAREIGRLIGDLVDPWIAAGTILFPDAVAAAAGGNIEPDGMFAGTGGAITGGTGSLAANWTFANNVAGVSCALSKGTLRGFESQAISFTGAASAENNFLLQSLTASGTITPHTFFDQFADVRVTANDGVSPPVGLKGLALGSAGAGRWNNPNPAAGYGPFDFTADGVLRSFPAVLNSGSALTAIALEGRLLPGTVDVLIHIARFVARSSELTAYGFPTRNTIALAPSVTGTVAVGQTLSGLVGTWIGGGLTFEYQWQRGTTDIPGANGATYVVQAADSGSTLRRGVRAVNSFGASAFAYSANTIVVP